MTIERVEQNIIGGKISKREELPPGHQESFLLGGRIEVLSADEVFCSEVRWLGQPSTVFFQEEINTKAHIGTLRIFPFPPRLIYYQWRLSLKRRERELVGVS